MQFGVSTWPSHLIFPVGFAMTFGALFLYAFWWRKPETTSNRLLIVHLGLTVLWAAGLLARLNQTPTSLVSLTGHGLVVYGLVFLGFSYWLFARTFLQQAPLPGWNAAIGLLALALVVSFDQQWVVVPAGSMMWSRGWLHPENLGFSLSLASWGLFMLLTAGLALTCLWQTHNPSHRNRIQYLLIATTLLTAGYTSFLAAGSPVGRAGVIAVGLGGALSIYIVMIENLPDLGTGVRRLIRIGVVITVVTLAYILGYYLVKILFDQFLPASLAGYLNESLLIATVTIIFLTIFLTPIHRFSRNVANRLLFGQEYDYQAVVQNYGQVINNRLFLIELTSLATNHIDRALGLARSALFILGGETPAEITLRALPTEQSNGRPSHITLSKDSPVARRLALERQPLAQYTIDISPQFKQTPAIERQALQDLNYEWFIPIHREERLVGVFAVATKKSGRPYSNQDITLLTTIADQTALALENATLFDRVQRNLEEMTRMKNLMDGVFASMDNAVITTDVAGKITFYNRAAETILAKSLEGTIGRPYSEIYPSLANTIFANMIENVIKREEHYPNREIISDLPERGKVNLSVSLSSLKDAKNRTQGVTIVVNDLTETKRLEAVRDMFRRYLSPAVVDRLPSDPNELELGGQRQEVTILFADIRGFTSFSENLAPEALVEVLNQYLSKAARAILAHKGTLDKFMGDAVMGIFNAPLPQADHVWQAVRAALAMQQAITDYHRSVGDEPPLQFGVGLHVGEVVVGNIGMSDRMDYTAVGDAVNLAKRIQENSPGGKILISEAVRQVVAGQIEAVFFQEMQVKGRQRPVRVYELKGAKV